MCCLFLPPSFIAKNTQWLKAWSLQKKRSDSQERKTSWFPFTSSLLILFSAWSHSNVTSVQKLHSSSSPHHLSTRTNCSFPSFMTNTVFFLGYLFITDSFSKQFLFGHRNKMGNDIKLTKWYLIGGNFQNIIYWALSYKKEKCRLTKTFGKYQRDDGCKLYHCRRLASQLLRIFPDCTFSHNHFSTYTCRHTRTWTLSSIPVGIKRGKTCRISKQLQQIETKLNLKPGATSAMEPPWQIWQERKGSAAGLRCGNKDDKKDRCVSESMSLLVWQKSNNKVVSQPTFNYCKQMHSLRIDCYFHHCGMYESAKHPNVVQ